VVHPSYLSRLLGKKKILNATIGQEEAELYCSILGGGRWRSFSGGGGHICGGEPSCGSLPSLLKREAVRLVLAQRGRKKKREIVPLRVEGKKKSRTSSEAYQHLKKKRGNAALYYPLREAGQRKTERPSTREEPLRFFRRCAFFHPKKRCVDASGGWGKGGGNFSF